MELKGKQYTVTATAATLTSILSLTDDRRFQQIDFFNDNGSTGSVYLGASTVTNVPANAFVEMQPGKGYSIGPLASGFVHSDSVYVVGTAADILYISAVPF